MIKTVAQKASTHRDQIPEATENRAQDGIAVLEAELEGQRVEAERGSSCIFHPGSGCTARRARCPKRSTWTSSTRRSWRTPAMSLGMARHSHRLMSHSHQEGQSEPDVTVGPDTPVVEIEHPAPPGVSVRIHDGANRLASRDAIAVIPTTKVVVRHLYTPIPLPIASGTRARADDYPFNGPFPVEGRHM